MNLEPSGTVSDQSPGAANGLGHGNLDVPTGQNSSPGSKPSAFPQLTGPQLGQLQRVVCLTFDPSDFKRMLAFSLNERLDLVTSQNQPFTEIVFEVFRWAQINGQMRPLILAIRDEKPTHDELQSALKALLGSWYEAPPPPPPPQPKTLKAAYVIQALGEPDSDARVRADRVWKGLIVPACRDAGFEPFRADGETEVSVTEPIGSPLFKEPLVIDDLGSPPWSCDVMIEVGFRMAAGRSMLFLVPSDVLREELPAHIQAMPDLDRRILQIRAREPDGARRDLTKLIQKCTTESSNAWKSHYAFVDFEVPLADPASARFTNANDAAARIYGLKSASELLGELVAGVEEKLLSSMPDQHRREFEKEQGAIFGQVLRPTTGSQEEAAVKVPIWLARHSSSDEKDKIYLPLLVNYRFNMGERVVSMRTLFVDISSWIIQNGVPRESSLVLRIPRMFRPARQFDYDVFLPFDAGRASYMRMIRDLMERFDCSVFADRDGIQDLKPKELIRRMRRSRMVALPVGKTGLGAWAKKPEVHKALLGHCAGKQPLIVLLLPELQEYIENREWLQFLPEEFREPLSESLFLSLPGLEEMRDAPPPGHSSFLERIIRELLNILRQVDADDPCDDP
ncbi:MAG: hypothetical protein EHM42_04235 [Planctomycetaceae bacterium]|nr:MAG: hypothetical protein EHM42_04235 [Planctomycetaceae bacterium]